MLAIGSIRILGDRERNVMKYGKMNIAAGLLFMAGFMIYGFILIDLRDFGPTRSNGSLSTPPGNISKRALLMCMATCSRF